MDISLPEIIGGGYGAWWKSKKRYVVCKGSRGSKKSKTTAIWMIYSLIKYPLSNGLCVRKVYNTLKDSCFTDLKWAARRLGVYDNFDWKVAPLEVVYKPTGQKVLFRGMDDAYRLASISVDIGVLNYVWVEEAYEISSEDDFQTLDESIRGEVPEGYIKQIRLTFNPWSERSWLKSRFFDNPDEKTFSCTTTYLCNEWLDENDRENLEKIKERNPRRYKVAGLGEWGVADGLVYENWTEREFELVPEMGRAYIGLDFGYTNDPSAMLVCFYRKDTEELYIWDEVYGYGMSNRAIYDACIKYRKEKAWADSAEPKSIEEIRTMGWSKLKPVKKGKDSIMAGVQWLQDKRIVVHPRCVNTIRELGIYHWDKDKFGKSLNKPADEDNHTMDALRYAVSTLQLGGSRLLVRRARK